MNITKTVIGSLFSLVLLTVGISTSALRFESDTIFLGASTQESCEDLGGSFTERYGEIYCTTTPSEVLSTSEQELVSSAAQKIVGMVGSDEDFFVSVLQILGEYKSRFDEEKDVTKIAIMSLLIRDLEANVTFVPTDCVSWFDGCNKCDVEKGEITACTEIACTRREEASCTVYEKRIDVASYTQECVGVGPQRCLLISEEGQGDWTYYYDDIEGFEYEEGYAWTLLIEETHRSPFAIGADESTIVWKLLEVVSKVSE